MKEKIKKIFQWLLRSWTKIAGIIVVIWAIKGMYGAVFIPREQFYLMIKENYLWRWTAKAGINLPLALVLFYFLSAVLILYLLRKFQKQI